jgi:thiamine kinase-like enzyme
MVVSKMDIVIGALIGQGATADVFDIGDNKVVKLFHSGYSENARIREWENSILLDQVDIPIAKSYGMITYKDRYGIVYDKINGVSLLEILLQTYDVEKYAKVMADIHKQLLSKDLPGAASIKSILQRNIEHADGLSGISKAGLLDMLHALPDSNGLCHGDFHFGNILMTQQGCYVIDFMNICKGHRYSDIARTVYLTEFTPVPKDMPDREKILEMKTYAADFYLKEMGVRRVDLSDWLTVTFAARLYETGSGPSDEREHIMQYLSKKGF